MAYNLTTSGLTLGSDVFTNAKDVGLAAYPVGAIYMSLVSTSPATLFGGTWEALDEGRVLIGANSTYEAGSTGGEATHTLTAGEMPSHKHGRGDLNFTTRSFKAWVGDSESQPSGNGIVASYADNWKRAGGNYTANRFNYSIDTSTATWTGSLSNTGGSQPHNNMQPYLAVYMWKRTA